MVHDAMLVHCRAVLRAIDEHVRRAGQLPRMRFRTVVHDGPNATRGAVEVRVYWRALAALPAASQPPTYEAAVTALANDPVAGPQVTAVVGSIGTTLLTLAHRVVEDFVASYLELRQGADWDAGTFEAAYERFERYWYEPNVALTATGPLYGFWSDVNEIALGPGLRIRQLTPAEQNRLGEQLELFEYLERPSGFTHPRFCLELRWNAPKAATATVTADVLRSSRLKAHSLFPRVLDALRLFKGGRVGCPYIGLVEDDWQPNELFYAPAPDGGSVSAGVGYRIAIEEVEKLTTFWRWFEDQDLQSRPGAALAIRRFGIAYERIRQEDRLLDEVIALEAMLLDDGDRQELSYRLSLRSAVLIGRDVDHRRGVFDRMRFAYGARSTVAHGDRLEAVSRTRIGGIDLTTFFTLLEQDIREIIVEYLRLPPTGGARLMRDLDESILEGRFRDDLPRAGGA